MIWRSLLLVTWSAQVEALVADRRKTEQQRSAIPDLSRKRASQRGTSFRQARRGVLLALYYRDNREKQSH